MSYLILKHKTSQDLPDEWAKLLPEGQTFTVSIVAENTGCQSETFVPVDENKGMYAYPRQWKQNFFDPS